MYYKNYACKKCIVKVGWIGPALTAVYKQKLPELDITYTAITQYPHYY